MNTSCFSGVEKGFANIFSIIRKFATLITATNLLLRQKQTTNEYVFSMATMFHELWKNGRSHVCARDSNLKIRGVISRRRAEKSRGFKTIEFKRI